ncbi:MAG TPA: hypothetical protein VFR58_14510 [Flavisolibacter sp.]|nr:hypothetical protein [Flavisolibacter sp.]
MKKRNVVVAALIMACVFASSIAKAQDVKGKNYLNAGIGLGTYGFSGTGGLPVTVSFEHGFTDKISGGLYLGMVNRKYLGDWKYNYKVVGLRGSYHFNEALGVDIPNLDLYGGLSIYHRSYVLKYELSSGGKEKLTDGILGIGIHAAARYMFSKNIGGFAELGYGVSPLQLGASFVF